MQNKKPQNTISLSSTIYGKLVEIAQAAECPRRKVVEKLISIEHSRMFDD